ncbi:ferric reductase fre2 precursor [Fusarium sporotrichioides]|uniref:Ferric reductase fre2 n=1 Tax=Fusarium sporotrichioides TaxID=5514 RepID=A0A395SCB2_FUSSP|nr:ferric reductase fre2 precursor [Fusarium sporotrichioides]
MDSLVNFLGARHIQNMSEASELEPHWGYADRALPCVKDAKTCQYLDLVYSGHDYSMLFVGIFWAMAIVVLFIWAFCRKISSSPRADEFIIVDNEKALSSTTNRPTRVKRAMASFLRSYLLPDSIRIIFGRTTRLQVVLLATLTAYMIIVSFAGLTYRVWVVAVPDMEGVNTIRTTLGPWSNRIGVLAYALTPLTVMLASRESILSLLTGVPYQSFNFLHRWLGYIILAQGLLHTIGWIVIETKLYAPQPAAAMQLITETYMIWGIVATLLILLLFVLSLPFVIRLTGYEFFRKAHYVLAMVYIGACYAHWDKLSCFLYSSLIIWAIDRALRLIRSGLIHYQYMDDGSIGFKAIHAAMNLFPDSDNGDVLRLDFVHSQDPWNIGQHFYLCFTECSIWQSHPFTPLSLPVLKDGVVRHSYILRAKQGETKKLAEMARKRMAESRTFTTPVILSGSYGESFAEDLAPETNILCVAGGTGITYVLPVLLSLISQPSSSLRKVQLIWAIRRESDKQWVRDELESIYQASGTHAIEVHVYVTREVGSPTAIDNAVQGDKVTDIGPPLSNPSDSDEVRSSVGRHSENRHPDLKKMIPNFVRDTVRGPTTVFASGPGSMISDLRSAVAACNSGAQVWKGNDRCDVSLICDNRLE